MNLKIGDKYYSDHRGKAWFFACTRPNAQCAKHGINLARLPAEDVLNLAQGTITDTVAKAAIEALLKRGFLEVDGSRDSK